MSISVYSFNAGLPRSGKHVWKMNFLLVREKTGNFVDGQGSLERTRKVRKFENNGYDRQSSENLFILSKREKGILSHEIV